MRDRGKIQAVYFDGDCLLCRFSAEQVIRRTGNSIVMIPFQNATGSIHSQMEKGLLVVGEGSRHVYGYNGMLWILSSCGRLGRWCWMVGSLPILADVGNWMYGKIAHNRYWIGTILTRILTGK